MSDPCVVVLPMGAAAPEGALVVDTTARWGLWRQLSPFSIGPCPVPGEPEPARCMENAWQFAKVYDQHATEAGDPSASYWIWARRGWADPTPRRYPMGRGAVPRYSLWAGERLGYVEARKAIYAPLYVRGVAPSAAFARLKALRAGGRALALRDYDAYDHRALGMSLTDVLNEPRRKMGHAFVLAAMLLDDPALGQLLP